MDKMIYLSRLMSYWLRHNPDDIGIKLDNNGWTDFNTFVTKSEISKDTIEAIVENCKKQRFTIKDGKIRANQGHTIKLTMEFEEVVPPDALYHGTAEKYLEAIKQHGLKPMARHHVHLSADKSTALQVGGRRGNAKILTIDTKRMRLDGITFYISSNGVYLVDKVNPQYIIKVD